MSQTQAPSSQVSETQSQVQVPEHVKQEIKKEVMGIREMLQVLPTKRLKELEEKIKFIEDVIEEVLDILYGDISKVMLRFEYADPNMNHIEVYGFYSKMYYATISNRLEISTHELEKALNSPEVVIGAVKVLASAVGDLTKTILEIIYGVLHERESDP